MARPLRFRHAPGSWDLNRVKRDLLQPLDANLGATMSPAWYAIDGSWETRRFDMNNGDTALFAWNGSEAYWVGNTETPSTLWRTEKEAFDEAPSAIATWAERELLAEVLDDEPWLEAYEHICRFFLPVLASKDGRESTRAFFRDHAAGFRGADRANALRFYDEFLASGVLDDYRHVMAGKLGTSEQVDARRMAATMSEFTVALLLTEVGCSIEPEAAVSTGHAIEYRANDGQHTWLVEVTRPSPPATREADDPAQAVIDTVATKTDGQLDAHGGGVTLFVDCSSFTPDGWNRITELQPDVGHRPALVFRVRPDRVVEGYRKGSVPIEMDNTIRWR